MSDRLTPRQFEMINNEFSQGGTGKNEVLGRIKDVEHAAFMDRRELIRLA